MARPRLSFCIPTYNFGRFIGATLDSILEQADDRVEIVVLDSESTDDTAEAVATRREQFPYIKYHVEPRRGIDRDLARVVDLSSGDICWTLSADDLVAPLALQRVLAVFEDPSVDAVLCGVLRCELDMSFPSPHTFLLAPSPARFDLTIAQERREFFRRSVTTTAFFSFCSANVFRRELWERVPIAEEWVGSCWAHVPRFFGNLESRLTVQYLGDPCVLRREGNDSFVGAGRVNRLAIAVDGFQRIADALFGRDSEEALCVRRALRREHGARDLLLTKMWSGLQPERENRKQLDQLVAKLCSDRSTDSLWLRTCYTLTPVPLLLGIRRVRDLLLGR